MQTGVSVHIALTVHWKQNEHKLGLRHFVYSFVIVFRLYTVLSAFGDPARSPNNISVKRATTARMSIKINLEICRSRVTACRWPADGLAIVFDRQRDLVRPKMFGIVTRSTVSVPVHLLLVNPRKPPHTDK